MVVTGTPLRVLDPLLAAENAKPVVRPFYAVSIAFPDPVWIWTGLGTIEFNGQKWVGIGGVDGEGNPVGIGSIESIGQGTDGSATGLKVTVVGIPSEWRQELVDQAVRGVDFLTYYGALDQTHQVVIGYQLIERARLDTYQIVDNGDDLSVVVTGESRMLDQRRPSIKRYTDGYQQAKYPGDRFFEYMPLLAEIPILWAKGKQDSSI